MGFRTDVDPCSLGATLVDAARAAGADEADAFIRDGRITRVTLQRGYVSESSGWQTHLALRAWRGGRCSIATTNDVQPSDLTDFARSTVAAAAFGMRLAPLVADGPVPPLAPGYLATPLHADERRGLLESILRAVERYPEVDQALVTGCYTESLQTTALVSSRGFAAAYPNPEYRLWLWVDGAKDRLIAAGASRRPSEVVAATLASYERQRAVALNVSSHDIPTGPCEVLLSPSVGADLARSLGVLLAADNVLGHLKPLLAHMDAPIAAPAVTLVDDGGLPGGLKSRPVDDEGSPTKRTTLIERGRLRNLLHSLHTAAAVGARTNGKATRPRLWQQPRPTPSAIHFAPGVGAADTLRQQLRRGLEVTDALRPGRIQSTTGKFTAIVCGWWVEDGRRVRAVSGVPLAANIFDLLRAVRACGNDIAFSSLADGAGSPSLLVDRMVAG